MSPGNELFRNTLSRQRNSLIDHPEEPDIHMSTVVATLMMVDTHPCLEYGWLHLKT